MTVQRKVLVETSVLSFLVSRRSNNPVYASMQLITRQWWKRRHEFALFTSPTVREEIQLGDSGEAKKRLTISDTMDLLPLTPEAERLGALLVARGVLPKEAQTDALHPATAAIASMDFVASWNHRHLVNDDIQKQCGRIFAEAGYNMPDIRTPFGLLELIK